MCAARSRASGADACGCSSRSTCPTPCGRGRCDPELLCATGCPDRRAASRGSRRSSSTSRSCSWASYPMRPARTSRFGSANRSPLRQSRSGSAPRPRSLPRGGRGPFGLPLRRDAPRSAAFIRQCWHAWRTWRTGAKSGRTLPHLTIARVRDGGTSADRRAIDDAPFGTSERALIDHVTLYQSRLTPRGPEYTARASGRLAPLEAE